MEIRRVGSQPSGRARRNGSPVRCTSTCCSPHPIQRASAWPTSPLSRMPAPRGTPIRSGKGWSSLPPAVGCSAPAARSARSEPATWSCVRPARSTGTQRLRRPAGVISPSRRRSTARSPVGWRRSPTRNTWPCHRNDDRDPVSLSAW